MMQLLNARCRVVLDAKDAAFRYLRTQSNCNIVRESEIVQASFKKRALFVAPV